jgi:hypothetical protein
VFEQSVLWSVVLMPVRLVVAIVTESVAYLLRRILRPDNGRERDQAAVTVMAESAVGRGVVACIDAVDRGWQTSVARLVAIRTTRVFSNASAIERLRSSGIATTAAAATVLVLRLAASPPTPLTWIVPSVAAFVGAILIVATQQS